MSGNNTNRSDDELIAAWLEDLKVAKSIEHVGAYNRHFAAGMAITAELIARGDGQPTLFRPLLDHPDPQVRYNTAFHFRDADPELFRATLVTLQTLGGQIGQDAKSSLEMRPWATPIKRPALAADHPIFWQVNHPPPPAMDCKLIARRLREACPAESEALLKLAQPAIGLWPQRPRAHLPVHASRLGGMPHAPPDFEWPMAATEPMLFLGQINCADLKNLPGAEHFPSEGLLALFGDHDTINGCMLTAQGGALFHWSTDHLIPAKPPLELADTFLVCELAFRPIIDMPHPDSEIVRDIVRDDNAIKKYTKFHDALRLFGISKTDYSYGYGKLLGWPYLVQNDDLELYIDGNDLDFRLLIQIDTYSNGEDLEGYGPGGSLYFMILENDLEKGRFEKAQLTGQFT